MEIRNVLKFNIIDFASEDVSLENKVYAKFVYKDVPHVTEYKEWKNGKKIQ